MNHNREIAEAVLKAVGGKENISSVLHCMTRLRFKLKDDSIINLAQVKAVKGVMGAQFAEQSLHVIIGLTVSDVYKELLAVSGLEQQEAVEENLDEKIVAPKKTFTPMAVVNGILNTFTSSMTPLIPIFVLMGMANVVAALLGPSFLGLVAEESDLYKNFYYIYQTILYFLPILLAISASKVFKCNTMISVVLGALMLYPDMIAALGSEAGYTIYGIAVPNVTYSGQVIPIILVVWIMSYVEKFVNRVVPKALKVIGVPFGIVLIMLPLEFCILGPLGMYIGTALGNFLLWLHSTAGVLETTLMGVLGIFLVAFGFGRPIFFICLGALTATGVEYAYMPISMVITNFVAMGISAGYTVKVKSSAKKEMGISCLASAFLGGVSEPTIFGIIMTNRKTFLPCVIGGGLGGLYIGLMKVGYYQFGPSNFMSVAGFVSSESSSNLIHGCIAAVIALVVSFATMLMLFQDEKKDV